MDVPWRCVMVKIDKITLPVDYPDKKDVNNLNPSQFQKIDKTGSTSDIAPKTGNNYKSSLISSSVNDVNYIVNTLNARLRSLEFTIDSMQKSEARKEIAKDEIKKMEEIATLVSAQMKMNSSTALMAQANIKMKNVLNLL